MEATRAKRRVALAPQGVHVGVRPLPARDGMERVVYVPRVGVAPREEARAAEVEFAADLFEGTEKGRGEVLEGGGLSTEVEYAYIVRTN